MKLVFSKLLKKNIVVRKFCHNRHNICWLACIFENPKGKLSSGGRTNEIMSSWAIARTNSRTLRRGRRGQPYPASRDATTPFFFGFLSSHDIAPKGIKGWWGHAGTPARATDVIPDNAARGSLLTWTAVSYVSLPERERPHMTSLFFLAFCSTWSPYRGPRLRYIGGDTASYHV